MPSSTIRNQGFWKKWLIPALGQKGQLSLEQPVTKSKDVLKPNGFLVTKSETIWSSKGIMVAMDYSILTKRIQEPMVIHSYFA